MKLYQHHSYRAIIRDLIEESKSMGQKLTLTALAEGARIQKSYLSKVLAGGADLTTDQLYLVAQTLKLGTDEIDYLNLCLEFEKCQIPERKLLLKSRLEARQRKHLKTDSHIQTQTGFTSEQNFQDYYMDPFNQIVHVGLCIPKYTQDIESLREELGLTKKRIFEILKHLERLQVIRKTNKGFEILIESMHLSKDSLVYPAWRERTRVLSLQRMQQGTDPDAYHFTVVFAAQDGVRKALMTRFLEFLKQSEADVLKSSKRENLYQLNFDLFAWTGTKK